MRFVFRDTLPTTTVLLMLIGLVAQAFECKAECMNEGCVDGADCHGCDVQRAMCRPAEAVAKERESLPEAPSVIADQIPSTSCAVVTESFLAAAGGLVEMQYAVDGAPCIAQVYRDAELVESQSNPTTGQHVQVYASRYFGKILTINGGLMITTRDEHRYHEVLAHTPLAYLPHAARILVVGGGDGGLVSQALQHTNIREIVWCEIDEVVLRVSRQHFPQLAAAQTDPRVNLRIEDAAAFVAAEVAAATDDAKRQFDAILVDSTDSTVASSLFEAPFYSNCKRLLAPTRGILAYNLDSPSWNLKWVAESAWQAAGLFRHAYVFHAAQPTYASGHYAFLLASDTIHPFRQPPDWRALAHKRLRTKYYTPDTHVASFVLPAQIARALPMSARLHELPPGGVPPPEEAA